MSAFKLRFWTWVSALAARRLDAMLDKPWFVDGDTGVLYENDPRAREINAIAHRPVVGGRAGSNRGD